MKTNYSVLFLRRTGGMLKVLAALLAGFSTHDAHAQGSITNDFPTLKRAPDRAELVTAIEKCQRVVQRFKGGHVVIGRIVLDGPGDPRDVAAQMPILAGGYFAGETKDLSRPISFRMHQYAPLDVQLQGQSGDIVDLGELHLACLPPDLLGDLTGRIVLAGGSDPTKAKVVLTVCNGPANTPHNGTSPRSHWPEAIRAGIASSGSVTAKRFSPIAYWCSIEAPGYVSQSREITFTRSQTFDLGTVTLNRPITAQLSYIISQKPPFDLKKKQMASVQGGQQWKATPDIYGWDLEFKQTGNQLFFNYSYGPCSLTDLGAGTLEEFAKTTSSADSGRFPSSDEITTGHVYLLNQEHWKRWVLFRVDVK